MTASVSRSDLGTRARSGAHKRSRSRCSRSSARRHFVVEAGDLLAVTGQATLSAAYLPPGDRPRAASTAP